MPWKSGAFYCVLDPPNLSCHSQVGFFSTMSVFSRDRFHILFYPKVHRYGWKGMKILLIWFFGSLVAAAILSPLAYQFTLWWHTHSPNDLTGYLTEKSLPDYFDRLRWLVALATFPWVVFQCGLASSRKLGFKSRLSFCRYFDWYFILGMASIAGLIALQQMVGASTFREGLTTGFVLNKILISFLAALLVALGEELVFRAVVLRMFYTAFVPAVSVALSALFFAYLHFDMPAHMWAPETQSPGIADGFYVALWTVFGVTQSFSPLLFLNLALVGYILAVVFMRTRSLWASIGLHAGWVTLILSYSHFGETPSGESSLWWGSHRLADGFLCLGFLLLTAWVVTALKHPRARSWLKF